MTIMSGTNVYIDGFNLYYGCLKDSPYKWLDLESLCERLLPSNRIGTIRYFTARVNDRADDPGGDRRQAIYLRALGTLPKVVVHFGHFLSHPVRMPLAHPKAHGPKTAEVIKTEEKGSDVNLATYLLVDAFDKVCRTAVVISNDGDLKEPLRIARDKLRLKIGVVNPNNAGRRSQALVPATDFYKTIRASTLEACQFPAQLTDGRGTFSKPSTW